MNICNVENIKCNMNIILVLNIDTDTCRTLYRLMGGIFVLHTLLITIEWYEGENLEN